MAAIATEERKKHAVEVKLVHEVPTTLKQLARLVVRGFYTVEDVLIVDMLVRNPCMKEDDIAELLRFEKKQLRARLAILRSDKFVQVRLKMETGPDAKAQKVNYYFINYKIFVNVVKYKLDLMRKRMEMEDRDATSRASFRCLQCNKTFTDLEADQLFDFMTHEFRCTFCCSSVEEDTSAMPKKDSRLMLARFNDQIQPLFDILRAVEGIQLSPELLEPEPVDIDFIRGRLGYKTNTSTRDGGQQWSGEATRNQGFHVEETRVDINIADEEVTDMKPERERPIWMTKSTLYADATDGEIARVGIEQDTSSNPAPSTSRKKDNEDIMSVLLQYEKPAEPGTKPLNLFPSNAESSSSETDSDDFQKVPLKKSAASSDSDERETDMPTVYVGRRGYAIDQITPEIIAQMTQQEKDNYIDVYQKHFSHYFE